MINPPLDSSEGMKLFAAFMRAHRFVASEFHEQLADKYGVDFSGITVARGLPTTPT